ncbi:inositol monophosphatase family protein [Halocatena marina]|uniref:fructose-bisphosphatase n=1 Tax=Halocatena marina TaxID=2934937 RepID=A0ABD5YI76_9EURY|nr:inositol monophosphatase [Halocatena marina]
MVDAESRVMVADRAAHAGAEVAMQSFRTAIAVDTKASKTDVVTQADRDTQARVRAVIEETFPDEAIVGEEADARKTVPDTGVAWIVDPIDGTSNYVRGVRMWTTSVACLVDGECVAAANVFPALGDAYIAGPDGLTRNGDQIEVSSESDPEAGVVSPTLWWDFDHRDEFSAAVTAVVERFGDLRRSGCTQGTLSHVASGGLDAAISNVDHSPWDTVAGAFMIEQAGGTVTDLTGDRWRYDATGLVASNGHIHEEVLAAVRSIEDRTRT